MAVFLTLCCFCKRLISATGLAFRRVCGEPPRRLATLSGLTCPTHPAGVSSPINYSVKNIDKISQLQQSFRKERVLFIRVCLPGTNNFCMKRHFCSVGTIFCTVGAIFVRFKPIFVPCFFQENEARKKKNQALQ
jgi:hypothetical protein